MFGSCLVDAAFHPKCTCYCHVHWINRRERDGKSAQVCLYTNILNQNENFTL